MAVRKRAKGMGKQSGSLVQRIPFGVGFTVLAVLFFAVLLISVCVGSASLNAADALRLLLAKVPGMGGLMAVMLSPPNHAPEPNSMAVVAPSAAPEETPRI